MNYNNGFYMSLQVNNDCEGFQCDLCGMNIDSLKNLRQHWLTCRSVDDSSVSSSPTNEPDSEDSQVFTCGQCDAVFNSLAELYTHRRGCGPDDLPSANQLCNDFTCDKCSLTPGS